jgi:predicted nuclease with TOPRIM domain
LQSRAVRFALKRDKLWTQSPGLKDLSVAPPKQWKGVTATPCPLETFKGNLSRMKKEDLRALIEEHMDLSKRIEELREELENAEDRYKKIGELLYGFRSKEFLRSVLSCLIERMNEYGKNPRFDDLVHFVIRSLQRYKDIDASKEFTSKRLLRLFDEKLE